MNNTKKTTALIVLQLLLFSVSFAGGWQKYLPNYGFNNSSIGGKGMSDDYLPTKDGGVMIYASTDYGSVLHTIIKLDKFGNIQWKKVINKTETIFTDSSIITKTYNSLSAIENVYEISNDRYVVLHNGPSIDTSYIIFPWRVGSAPHFPVRYFTVIDKYGNILSRKYDTLDLIVNNYTSDPFNKPNTSTFFYDSISSKYILFQIVNSNKLSKKTYDTAFNFLNESITSLNTNSFGIGLYFMEKFGSVLFISNYAYGGISEFLITDLSGNQLYNFDQNTIESIYNTIKDSAAILYPSCPVDFYYSQTKNLFQDFYFDNLSHLHLFNLLYFWTGSSDPACEGYKSILIHVEIDQLGNVIKTDVNDITNIHIYDYYTNGAVTVLPLNNVSCNIFINALHVGLEDYYMLKYNLNSNNIEYAKYVKNEGELKQIGNFDFQYFLRKNKSLIDNSYYCAFSNGANSSVPENSITSIFKIDSNGNINNHVIQGNVFADQNGNCIKNATDKNLPQVTVKAVRDSINTAYTSSDNNGNYSIGVGDSGLYTVTAQPNINYPLFAQSNCPVQTSYAYLDSFTIDTINLNLKPTILCPSMYVDISTPMLRRCFSNIYTVNYKNNGTIASPNTFIDVALDRFLTVNSASIPYTNLGNNVLRFNIGNVDYLSSGRFTIDVTVRCDSTIVGQTHCVEAHIYPDTVCAVASYTGPVISTTAICKHDSVEFKIRNSGGNMSQRKRYIVIEDNLNRLNGTFQLNTGQQQLVTIAADTGRTYGIIAEQDALFPSQLGDAYASAFIEGCNPVSGTFTTGIITQYPEFDGEPYRSVDCQQNRGSFDPNDKTGYPIGISASHNIEKNTAIDYKINFQNTGNDTAFKVVIVDTISKYLDINTIEPGASSHRYTYMRTDSNTIKFIFDNIKLVDSNKNEKLSHGFVKFRIQQKANNPNGTKIYNTAEIYFDYNSPIFTNKTMHTIGDVYVRIISKVINPTYAKADIRIYPNPFRDKTTIELQNIEMQKTNLVLIDITGKEILQLQSNNNQYEINGSDLAKGFYLFQIKNDKGEIANGKIIVQ